MKHILVAVAIVVAIVAAFIRPPHFGQPAVEAGAPPPAAGEAAGLGLGKRGTERTAPRRLVVYVTGEVSTPGVYDFRPGDRVQAALVRAGGAKADADLVAVNLAALLEDGEEVAFPKIGVDAPPRERRARTPRPRHSHAPRRRGHRQATTVDEPAPASVNLNAADETELETLPGIGSALARRIVDYRATNGPFTAVDELGDISGITEHLEETIAPFVTVR